MFCWACDRYSAVLRDLLHPATKRAWMGGGGGVSVMLLVILLWTCKIFMCVRTMFCALFSKLCRALTKTYCRGLIGASTCKLSSSAYHIEANVSLISLTWWKFETETGVLCFSITCCGTEWYGAPLGKMEPIQYLYCNVFQQRRDNSHLQK